MPKLVIDLNKKKRKEQLEKYHTELLRRAARTKAWYAHRIYKMMSPLSDFSTAHAHMWTGYFRANWNISFNDKDFSLVADERPWATYENKNEILGMFSVTDQSNILNVTGAGNYIKLLNDKIYICNGTPYGKWLRDGLNPNDIPSSYPAAQTKQMSSLDNHKFLNFQTVVIEDFRSLKWDDIMKRFRGEEEKPLTSKLHIAIKQKDA